MKLKKQMLIRKNKFHKYKYQKKQISTLKYKYVLQKTNYDKYKFERNITNMIKTNLNFKTQI